jgi:4-methylaminobutanoate oxidase (formaldehyde-forming)
MCGSGVTAAGGIGKLLADWIVYGEPIMDLWSLDMRRFLDIHNNTGYLRERAQESYG